MEKYKEASKLAVKLAMDANPVDPVGAWSKATKMIFPTSTSLQNKGCPRGAFLGLCNEGLVKDIPGRQYAKPSKNGEYAIEAVKILKSNRFLASQPELLWKKVVGSTKSENGQMDVVIGLWEEDMIVK